MRILILGGDGYCGWPVALRLSALGNDVTIVDNLVRRRMEAELGVRSLTPIAPIETRLKTWVARGNAPIGFAQLDVARDYAELSALIGALRPDAVVHFAEQRSVPYSEASIDAQRYTVDNNVASTQSLMCALMERRVDAHMVHLGSIGVYGYETLGYEIPEGYLKVRRVGPDGGAAPADEILHPFNPVSVYHLSKALDHVLLAFYARQHGARVTDLHQGTLWGAATEETASDPALINRLDHDDLYGTVLHRFAVQTARGEPISVYGSGQQTRAFMHVSDMVRCVTAAIESPPNAGERVRVVNQISETRSIIDIAQVFAEVSGVPIEFVENTRREPVENQLDASNARVRDVVDPILVDAVSVGALIDSVSPYCATPAAEALSA